jgi:hypothetical protein
MTDSVVHALAEQWLPIPMPDFKDMPPTMKTVYANAAVVRAQAQLTRQMMANAEHAEHELAKRQKYDRAVRSRVSCRR